MPPFVKTWVVIICLLIVKECSGNPLPERSQPYAVESEKSEQQYALPEGDEDGIPDLRPFLQDKVPDGPVNSMIPELHRQGRHINHDEELVSDRRLHLTRTSEGRNYTSEHNISREFIFSNISNQEETHPSEFNFTDESPRSSNKLHQNILQGNESVNILGGENEIRHRDQPQNLNFGRYEQQELIPIVKRTAWPSLSSETQNASLPLGNTRPEASETSRLSQSEIMHENDTNLEGLKLNNNELNIENNGNTRNVSTFATSIEAPNSNRVLPDVDPDHETFVGPKVESERNGTENRSASENFIENRRNTPPIPEEHVPLATIHIPVENPEPLESVNITDENVSLRNTTLIEPTYSKENKYRTKGNVPEMTLPQKEPDHQEITESNPFPRTFTPDSEPFPDGSIRRKTTTQNAREEVLRTTAFPQEPVIHEITEKRPFLISTTPRTIPTEQIIDRHTTSISVHEITEKGPFLISTTPRTIPTEQIIDRHTTSISVEVIPTKSFSVTNLFTSRRISEPIEPVYISTRLPGENGNGISRSYPPSEMVPEMTMKSPTQHINSEPTEPFLEKTTPVNNIATNYPRNSEETQYPHETVPHVTLHIPTEPMEFPSSTTVLPKTESPLLNGNTNPTTARLVTEMNSSQTTKKREEMASISAAAGESRTTIRVSDRATTQVSTPEIISHSSASHNNNESVPNSTTELLKSTSAYSNTSSTIPMVSDRTSMNRSPMSLFNNTSSLKLETTTALTSAKTSTDIHNNSAPTDNYFKTSPSRLSSSRKISVLSDMTSTMEIPKSNIPLFSESSRADLPTYGRTSVSPSTFTQEESKRTETPKFSHTVSHLATASVSKTTLPSTGSSTYNVNMHRPHQTISTTPKKQRTYAPTTKKPTETPKPNEKPGDTHSTPLVVPPMYISMQFRMTLKEFCSGKSIFLEDFTGIIKQKINKDLEETQIKFINQVCYERETENKLESGKKDLTIVTVDLYVADINGQIDIKLTADTSEFIKKGFLSSKSRYGRKLVNVHLITSNTNVNLKDESEEGLSSGMTIAIIIVIIGGICCICLIILQILMHRRHDKHHRNFLPGSNRFSLRSLDSIALNAVPKSRPHSGFWNPGLDNDESAPSSFSNSLGFNSLSNMTRDMVEIYKEFERLPSEMPSLSCVPIGAEDKNRFANVIPLSHSRVKLKKLPHEEHSDYINANFITGYNGDVHAYIATQEPLSNTIGDFWRMVWEQQSRVIIMLTAVNETSQPKDAAYIPDTEGINGRVRYGDLVLVLKKKEVRQEYIMSLLEIKDIENNLMREIRHFWFTSWSVDSIPEPVSVIKLILDTRVHYEDSGAPLIVHCSSGTGRTGALIATDISMRSYENKRVVDILGCVNNMRKERAGVVQNKEQYALIYKTLNEYAVIMGSPRLAPTSSSAIQLQHML
ncbi:uncharacterized protein LOC125648822 [Ostrea edulis]|uniref:uncharacterized protein LOC125648822 n=1 Tax=Ostrea edulis TaxID=37623 RepID=UPI0024AFD061|nr:uncharacterized protein LOC125648822 [Ostrea edulis]XP_048731769.2 uncharacterized protein LOC125648822 [Ostrea edulis]XP_056022779.1 uncharacterized protein LOC125648822 [Ostrea edulis]XP_056022780.1 uncharacterized protein LOC125648822 [Ostrea edulis]XP_056022781.1 uncharacterized protein LOC125648822 [Ostrea edulis]XP_056022782.1 uncharacterized protein LOC125648822 [Ostrea edulis]